MKKLKYILIVLLIVPLLLTGCIDGETIGRVDDTPPINVNVSSGSITASITTPLPVTITPSPLPVAIDNVTVREGSIPSISYYDMISQGLIAGHTAWSKTGFNPNVGTSMETVWSYSTQYVFPVAAMQMEVVSSDNTEDLPGGDGALTVTIYYLNGSFVEHSEVVALNGTTAVPTTHTDIYRVNGFRCTTVGTNGVPVGNITLRGVGGGTVYSYMLAGYTRARNIVYTVPEGKTLYITSVLWSCADATKGVRFINQANYDDVSGAPRSFFLPYGESTLYNTAIVRPLEIPTKFPEHTDVKISVISTQAGAIADVSLRGWLENN